MDCFRCQGKNFSKPLKCGHSYCPIFSKMPQFKITKIQKENFVGTSPSVFVGRYNYPSINVGILALPDVVTEESNLYDAPKEWSQRNFKINEVLDFRSVLINSKFQNNIKSMSKYVLLSQEVAMASKPVDIEYLLNKKPKYRMKTSDVETVIGANAELKRAMLMSNPYIDSRVDKVVSDTDRKANDSLNYLYKKGFDENFLTRILSIGTLGVKHQRKLVPTRWSITAVDDSLGKNLVDEVKYFKEADYSLFFGGYMGNYFLIMFFPRVWSYELFEMYMPTSLLNMSNEVKYTTDYEFFDGRKSYANNCVGGYYASRLAVLEKLKSMKKQATVLVLRFITDEYTTPLGVWVVREAVRKAMNSGETFNSEVEMIEYAQRLTSMHFHYNVDNILVKSQVLERCRTQKTLKDFFKF